MGGGARDLSEFVDRRSPAPPSDYLPLSNKYARMVAREIARAGEPADVYQVRRSYVRHKAYGLCPTLTANMGIGGHNVPFVQDEWGIRRLTVEECAALQGFDESALFPASVGPSSRYRMIGNAVSEAVACELARGVTRTFRSLAHQLTVAVSKC